MCKLVQGFISYNEELRFNYKGDRRLLKEFSLGCLLYGVAGARMEE